MTTGDDIIRSARGVLVKKRDAYLNAAALLSHVIDGIDAALAADPLPAEVPTGLQAASPVTSATKPAQAWRSQPRQSNRPHIEAVMRENAGRRLHVTEVVQLLAQRGHPVKTADPVNNVATSLRRMAKNERTVEDLGERYFIWTGAPKAAAQAQVDAD